VLAGFDRLEGVITAFHERSSSDRGPPRAFSYCLEANEMRFPNPNVSDGDLLHHHSPPVREEWWCEGPVDVISSGVVRDREEVPDVRDEVAR
jgi:hypothetical protein